MMKKRIAAALAVTMLAGALGTTALAAGENSTDVTVKVTSTAPDQMSVTVPTTLAIAVVGGGSNASVAPTTLIGSSFTDAGEMQGAGDTAGVGSLSFANASKTGAGADMDVTINSAVVTNNSGSKWTLVDSALGTIAGDKWKMNLSLNDQKAIATPGNDSAAINFSNLTIAGGKSKAVTVKAAAGGNATLYGTEDAGLNKAYVIEWSISKVTE